MPFQRAYICGFICVWFVKCSLKLNDQLILIYYIFYRPVNVKIYSIFKENVVYIK